MTERIEKEQRAVENIIGYSSFFAYDAKFSTTRIKIGP